MPLLSATPPKPHQVDAQTVFDGLAFMQAPINITRLAELLADHKTAREIGRAHV